MSAHPRFRSIPRPGLRVVAALLSLSFLACLAPIALAQEFTLHQQLSAVASGEGAPDGLFGWDVAIDGELAVACEVRLDGSPARVRTWRRNGTNWQRLPAHDVPLFGDSGCRLALAEGTLAITGFKSTAPSRGYIHILRYAEDGWRQEYQASSNTHFYDDVATSGHIVVAGAPLYGGSGVNNNGRIVIWRRSGEGSWSSSGGIIDPPVVQDGQLFGASVAIVAGAVVAGAPGMDIDAGGSLRTDAGAAYVYELTIDTWNLAASLVEPTGQIGTNHRFGSAVAISGLDPSTPDRLLVSSPANEGAGHAGIVRAYRRGAGTWEPAFSFQNNGAPTDDGFGYSLAMDGAWGVVGAPSSNGAAERAGAIVVVRFNAEFGGVSQRGERTDPAAAANDYLGLRVDIDRDGAAVIVGHLQADLYGNEQQGVVLTSMNSGDAMPPQLVRSFDLGQGLTGANAAILAVDGEVLVIGAPGEAVGSQHARGAAYVYRRGANGRHVLEARLLAPDGMAGDRFGAATAVRGDVLLVAAIARGLGGVAEAGAVYAFRRSGGNWTLETLLTPTAPGHENNMGWSLAFDGTTALIGERRYRTLLYQRSGDGVWTLAQELDRIAYNAALDGDSAVLTDHGAAAGGSNVGLVALYRRVDGTWQFETELVGAANDQQFGADASLHGGVLGVASWAATTPVIVYRRGSGGWLPEASLLPEGLSSTAFCRHVSVGDDVLALQCQDNHDPSFPSWVHVYERTGGLWSHVQRLDVPDGQAYSAFGYALAWNGASLGVGVPRKTIDFIGQGAVYVYVGDRIFRDGFN